MSGEHFHPGTCERPPHPAPISSIPLRSERSVKRTLPSRHLFDTTSSCTLFPPFPSGLNGVSNGYFHPGSREDNVWIDYSDSSIPKSGEDWKKMNFVDKTHWGFYCWPNKFTIYAPNEDQPSLKRSREDMTEAEGE